MEDWASSVVSDDDIVQRTGDLVARRDEGSRYVFQLQHRHRVGREFERCPDGPDEVDRPTAGANQRHVVVGMRTVRAFDRSARQLQVFNALPKSPRIHDRLEQDVAGVGTYVSCAQNRDRVRR